MSTDRKASVWLRLSQVWLAASRRPEFRFTVLAWTVWFLLLQAYQPWRYSSHGRSSFLDQASFLFWRIGFNTSPSRFVAIVVGLVSITCLVYLSGWVVRGFQPADSLGRAPEPPSLDGTSLAEDKGQAIHRHWSDLPEVVRQRLLARQTEKGFKRASEQWRFETKGQAASWGVVAAFCIWVTLLTFSWGHFESFQSSYFWAVVVTGCGAFLAYRSAFYLLRWRRARLKPFFYVTRLYFIR